MTTGKFTTSVAILALIAGLGSVANAQTAPQTEGQQVPATDAASLPDPLAALNLSDLQIETRHDGVRDVEGVTADGVQVEAKIDMAGNVIELEADEDALPQSLIEAYLPQAARDHEFMASFAEVEEINILPDLIVISGNQANGEDVEAAFNEENELVKAEFEDTALPASVIDALVPQSVRDGDIFAQFATVEEVGQMRDILMVKGQDADGKGMGAAFDQDGRVLRFGREGDGPRGGHGDDRGGDHGPRFGDDGPRGDGPHGKGERGDGPHGHDRDGHGPRDGDGPRGGREHGPRDGDGPRSQGAMGQNDMMNHDGMGQNGRGPRGDGAGNDNGRMAPMMQPGFDAVAVNKALSDAGYTDFGFLRPQAGAIVLEATNPQGENVLLELDADGELVRETAR